MPEKNLCITAMYPLSETDYISGIFVKEQIDALEEELKEEIEIFNLQKYRPIFRYTIAQISIIKKLIQGCYKNIHIHYAISGIFLLLYKPKKSKIIITFHGSDILVGDSSWKKKIQTFLSKQLAKRADEVILVSEHMREALPKIKGKISVIPCGINFDFFSQKSNVKVKNLTKDRTVIFPSDPKRLEKNYPLFRKIIDLAQSKNSQLNIEEIIFKDMSREEIRNSLNASDCLILTSISEGSPQVIKEAMACEIPILSTNVGNVKEMINGVDCTYIISEDNLEEAGNILVEILKSQLRSNNSKNALIALELDNISIAKKIANIYA